MQEATFKAVPDEDKIRDRAIRDCVDVVKTLEPLLYKSKYDGGWDCCGCSTIGQEYGDIINAIKSLLKEEGE